MFDKTFSNEEAAIYIAAFIDGEGHVGLHKNQKGSYCRHISFCNTDKQLFDFVVSLCVQLGFKVSVQFGKSKNSKWSDRWTAYIARDRINIEKFYSIIPIKCQRKRDKAEELIKSWSSKESIKLKKRKGVERPCETCGKYIYSSPAFQKRGGGRFCSKKCRGIFQRKRVNNICKICGSLYEIIASKNKSKFCSLSCFGKSNATRMAKMSKMAAQKRWNK